MTTGPAAHHCSKCTGGCWVHDAKAEGSASAPPGPTASSDQPLSSPGCHCGLTSLGPAPFPQLGTPPLGSVCPLSPRQLGCWVLDKAGLHPRWMSSWDTSRAQTLALPLRHLPTLPACQREPGTPPSGPRQATPTCHDPTSATISPQVRPPPPSSPFHPKSFQRLGPQERCSCCSS